MKFYFFYLIRIFFSKISNINKLSNYSIIFSTTLTVIFIVLTLSVTSGFRDNIVSKIIEIDGFARIYPKDYNSKINMDSTFSNSNFRYLPFFEKQFVIRNKNKSDGVNLLAINDRDLLSNYIIEEDLKIDDGIYIGAILSKNLNLNVGDISFLINASNNNREIQKIKIKGVFETNIPFYDEFCSFSINTYNQNLILFNKSNYDVYVVVSNNIYKSLSFLDDDYYIFTWEERHGEFVSWLYSYDIPIKILLFFVFLISVINNISIFNIDLINQSKNIFLLKSIGLSRFQIMKLFSLKNFVLNFISIFLGSLISFILIHLELKYKYIKIPENIYFSDSLPVVFDYSFFAYPIIIFSFFSILSTLIFSFYKSRSSF